MKKLQCYNILHEKNNRFYVYGYFKALFISINVSHTINTMKNIEFYRHNDTMKLGLIFKTFGIYLYPIIFVNFKTWFGASVPVV